MNKKRRTLYAIIFVEVMLAGIWFYLAQRGFERPDRVAPGFQATLGATMGQAMGAFLGFGGLLMFMAAKNDRAANARRESDKKS